MSAPGLQQLDATEVRRTIERLERRIGARFPDRGIRRVAQALLALADDVTAAASGARGWLQWLRVVTRALMALLLAGTAFGLARLADDAVPSGPARTLDWVPLIESGVNDLVFLAIAVFFLAALPGRVVRGRLLRRLHRLRSLAHIVDMHQLTKDPERLRADFVRTDASARPGLGRADMEHYLDYCSELLSLTSKVAALCAEESQDPLVLDTVGTIETLTTGMSRKIWQKISLLPDGAD